MLKVGIKHSMRDLIFHNHLIWLDL